MSAPTKSETPAPFASVASDRVRQTPFKPLAQKAPALDVQHRDDGSILVSSTHPMGDSPVSIGQLLADRAAEHPDRPYLMQRAPGHGPWQGYSYGEVKRAADGIAQWLLSRGLTADDSVMVLSANSVNHGLFMLGCYTAGVPIAPISPAYSLISTDHAKLKHSFETVKPKVVYAEQGEPFTRAFETLKALDPNIEIVTGDGAAGLSFADIKATTPTNEVEKAMKSLGHAHVAKYLFTSGSTGMPKGVPQTHGMMAGVLAGTNGLRTDEPDGTVAQVLEWMPWSHISAGNISFNGALWSGATLYLDEGKPIPGLFETTIKNLYEISPRVFGSAPIAFAMLAEAMENDPKLRKAFFSKLDYMGYGGATLSNDLYDRMQALAVAETGHRIPFTTMYGATETQGVTVVHWASERVGLIGLPLPGTTLKLVPNGNKYEVRVKGPTVTTGYHNDPKKTAEAFDEEGFYKLGDAVKFLDPDEPEQGLVFDGRVTEDFKLSSGTWVSVGTLRPDLVAATSPYIADAVIAGQDKPYISALVWPSPVGLQALAAEPGEGSPLEKLAAVLKTRVAAFNKEAGGSSRQVHRLVILTTPPSIDAGEITDKGYVNQRAALDSRKAQVDSLYTDPSPPEVIAV
jgi:feruloyl-CoA synthase